MFISNKLTVSYDQKEFEAALNHYLMVLQFRPRYSYVTPTRKLATPPELQGFSWPQLGARNDASRQNIRITSLISDAPLLSFLYSHLGTCFSKTSSQRHIAKAAFNTSFWFLEQLGPRAHSQLVATIHSERGRWYFENGAYREGIEDFEEAGTIWQIMGKKGGLAESLRFLGESYFKTGKINDAYSHLTQALQIARKMKSNNSIKHMEKLLSEVRTRKYNTGS